MKLQPNFSWQKYEGEKEDQREQFQYQLQSQHIEVANSVNSTIDDMSYFNRERMTSETWINGKAIWKKTISGVVVGTADTPYATGITGFSQLVNLYGVMQNPGAFTDAEPLPYVDPAVLAGGVALYIAGTDLHIQTGNATYNGYLFSVTIEYTKV